MQRKSYYKEWAKEYLPQNEETVEKSKNLVKMVWFFLFKKD